MGDTRGPLGTADRAVDHLRHAHLTGGIGNPPTVLDLTLSALRPGEGRHREQAIHPGERRAKAGRIVDVGTHHLGTPIRQRAGRLGRRVAHQDPHPRAGGQ
jgi:hypothetical protein